jgi:chromosome condensin MukBEF MukE localization factor
MNAQQKFEYLKDKYKEAYKNYNKKEVFSIYFQNGWVYLRSREDSLVNKFRVSQLEKMIKTLEAR